MSFRVINLGISSERDMVAVRQRAREVGAGLGFGAQDQVRIATAVSELARTAFAYAWGGNVEFALDHLGSGASLLIHIKSTGGDLREGAGARSTDVYPSNDTAGAGATLAAALTSARRLMDDCFLEQASGRARIITLRKELPTSSVVTAAVLAALADQALMPLASSFSEVSLQNKELLDTLAELRTKQDDLLLLTEELEATNRGVVALYAEIEEKAEKLRQADIYKDEFLATLAHELRNPLAPIRNAVEVMRRTDQADHAAHERAQKIISRQVDHLARLVDDLLDVARISKGKVTLQPAALSVGSFIQTAVETIGPFIDSRGHQLSVVLPADEIRVLGDPVRLAQIVGNLLNNAAKYTTRGGRILLQAQRTEAGRLRVMVQDNGIGLSAERIRSAFTMFSQGDTAPDRAQDGLGIGLPLVRQLVELHGGTIWVESAGTGHGSSFIMELPILDQATEPADPLAAKSADSAATAARNAVPAGAVMAGDATPPTSMRILLVDDNADSVAMTAMLLETLGHVTFTADDGPSAVVLASRHLPDLILLDIGLPGADGYEVARLLRQQPALRATRLIAVTGYGTAEDKKKALQAGFDHHLVKPVEVDVLIALISALSGPGTSVPA